MAVVKHINALNELNRIIITNEQIFFKLISVNSVSDYSEQSMNFLGWYIMVFGIMWLFRRLPTIRKYMLSQYSEYLYSPIS
jgi:hypothetical protein